MTINLDPQPSSISALFDQNGLEANRPIEWVKIEKFNFLNRLVDTAINLFGIEEMSLFVQNNLEICRKFNRKAYEDRNNSMLLNGLDTIEDYDEIVNSMHELHLNKYNDYINKYIIPSLHSD